MQQLQQLFEAFLNLGNIMVIVFQAIQDFNATISAAFPLYGALKIAVGIVGVYAIAQKLFLKSCRPV